MDWNEATTKLEAKLDPANVKKPSGNFGPKGDYIEGWHAIAEANRIFGFDGWSYNIKSMTQDSLRETKTARGDDQWQTAYTCIVTVTVGNVAREDVGFGSGFAKQIGDAIEGATKEAVTDALKRALRTFGNPFGLALYDKSRENVGVPEQPKPTPPKTSRAKADWYLGQIAGAKDADALHKWFYGEKVHAGLDGLDQPHRAEVEAKQSAKANELAPIMHGDQEVGGQHVGGGFDA